MLTTTLKKLHQHHFGNKELGFEGTEFAQLIASLYNKKKVDVTQFIQSDFPVKISDIARISGMDLALYAVYIEMAEAGCFRTNSIHSKFSKELRTFASQCAKRAQDAPQSFGEPLKAVIDVIDAYINEEIPDDDFFEFGSSVSGLLEKRKEQNGFLTNEEKLIISLVYPISFYSACNSALYARRMIANAVSNEIDDVTMEKILMEEKNQMDIFIEIVDRQDAFEDVSEQLDDTHQTNWGTLLH